MINMSSDALALQLYTAVLDGKGLSEAFEAIAQALGATAAIGQRMFLDADQFSAEPAAIHVNVSRQATITYARDWINHDPWLNALNRPHEGKVNFSRLVPPAAFRRHPIWVDFLSREAPLVFHGLSMLTRQPGAVTGYASFWRGEHAEPFGPAEEALFDTLLPHLRRAFMAESRLGGTARPDARLDTLCHGVGVISHERKLVFVNAALQLMAGAGDGLALAPDGFKLRAETSQVLLDSAIGRALQASSGVEECSLPARSVIAPDLFGTPRWRFEVLPLLPGTDGMFRDWSGAGIVVTDLQDNRDAKDDKLARRFKLTPAEAALAKALKTGMSLSEAAEARGVSRNTARTHLARLLAKTGSRRQSELVLKLASVVG